MKSRGNVVLVDEAVYDIHSLALGFEFRDLAGQLIDFKIMGVWRHPVEGYLTATKFGRQPVFLHCVGEPVPLFLNAAIQHPDKIDYWSNLLGEQ